MLSSVHCRRFCPSNIPHPRRGPHGRKPSRRRRSDGVRVGWLGGFCEDNGLPGFAGVERCSRVSKGELNQFRDLLITKRRELLAAVDSMEFEALRSDDGDTSSMPIHMADVGSDAYEQDLMLGMAASERERIREIDDALERIRLQTYGVCELTRKQISKKRLNAKPWAKYTIDSARKIERGL